MPGTFQVQTGDRVSRRARTLRRIVLTILTIVVLVGGFGLLGVRTTTRSVAAGEYTLTVEYASVSRPGLATHFGIQVRRAGGFDGPITLAVRSKYLAMFDENGLDPDPNASTADEDWVYWSFEQPDGETLAVDFDARIEPGVQWRRKGAVRLLGSNGETIARINYTTWVMP